MKKILIFLLACSFSFFIYSNQSVSDDKAMLSTDLEGKNADMMMDVKDIMEEETKEKVKEKKQAEQSGIDKNEVQQDLGDLECGKAELSETKEKENQEQKDNLSESNKKTGKSDILTSPEENDESISEENCKVETEDISESVPEESCELKSEPIVESITEENELDSEQSLVDYSNSGKKNDDIIQISEEVSEPKKITLSLASEEILARPDVEKFRQQYMTPKWSSLLYSYLESAMEYRLYVRHQVQKRNLPEILEYLPVVESNYKTKAKSYSGAVGMWQFMANSVYPFLTLNDFVDQRLDPWYSTDAGLSKLEDNYEYFGDWLIAIAAYNCGGGAMKKAIKNAGGVKDYWYLADNGYLPKQTKDYIPKLLAIADLAINSEYYGIDLPNHNEEFELLENEKNGIFDYITVNKAYLINDLAKELRIEQSALEKLNPSYVMGITHPTKESKIRLPIGLGSAAEDAIKSLTPIEYPFKYKVVSGDSLWSISRKYHVTVSEICELNNIKENDILSIGKILYIPSK